MSPSIPLQALRTFVEVGQRGSIKAAAQALHVTPGAVSQQIRLLEDIVGGAGEVQVPRGGFEGAQGVEREQGSDHRR